MGANQISWNGRRQNGSDGLARPPRDLAEDVVDEPQEEIETPVVVVVILLLLLLVSVFVHIIAAEIAQPSASVRDDDHRLMAVAGDPPKGTERRPGSRGGGKQGERWEQNMGFGGMQVSKQRKREGDGGGGSHGERLPRSETRLVGFSSPGVPR